MLPAIFAGIAEAVPPAAGDTVALVVRLASYVVGGGAVFFAIPAGATVLRSWMSPMAAIWTSLIVIFVVVAIAVEWEPET